MRMVELMKQKEEWSIFNQPIPKQQHPAMLLSAALRHRSAAPRLLHPRLFRWFSVDASFVQAHQVYAAKSGRATIPPKFVLNGPSWPSNLEGYELGKVAAKYRKQYRELNLPEEDF